VIEITRAMLDEKMKIARGDAPFVEDRICEELLALSLPEFRKLPGIVQTYAGLHDAAKRRLESLKESD
jgi:hypothetical protein